MAALIGRHTNEIDKKGHVSALNAFREALSISTLDQPDYLTFFSEVYICRFFKYAAIGGCSGTFKDHLMESSDKSELFSESHYQLKHCRK